MPVSNYPMKENKQCLCEIKDQKQISRIKMRKHLPRYAAKSDQIVLCSRSECDLFQRTRPLLKSSISCSKGFVICSFKKMPHKFFERRIKTAFRHSHFKKSLKYD